MRKVILNPPIGELVNVRRVINLPPIVEIVQCDKGPLPLVGDVSHVTT